jgi:hypothetical protein
VLTVWKLDGSGARALIEASEKTRADTAELFKVDIATLRRAMGKV